MTTHNRPRSISELIPALTKDVFGRKNALFGKMIAEWSHIAGPDIAACSTPLELRFQRQKEGAKGAAQAVLHLGVQSAQALEISYQKSLLIERLNMFFGYAAIKDIKIIQHSEILNNKKPPKTKPRPITMQEQKKIDDMVTNVPGDELQQALKNLGKAILSRKQSNQQPSVMKSSESDY